MTILYQKEEEICALCACKVPSQVVYNNERAFCCRGCCMVFEVLTAKNYQGNFIDSDVFQKALGVGLISNPQLKGYKKASSEGDFRRLHLEISDLWCVYCAQLIEIFLLQKKGVLKAIVDYTTDLACVEYGPRYLSLEDIFFLIKQLGYSPISLEDQSGQDDKEGLIFRFYLACFCALNVMMFSYPVYVSHYEKEAGYYTRFFSLAACFFSLPLLFYSAHPIWKRFWLYLQVGFVGMEALLVLGVVSAFTFSSYQIYLGTYHIYYDSMCMIVLFLLFGKILESKAKFSVRLALTHLYRALPKRGRKVLEDGRYQLSLLKEVIVGDLIAVFSGEKIVLDGCVEKGEGLCDESHITGESLLKEKSKGDPLVSGSILHSGTLFYRVTRSSKESALQSIVEILEKDLGKRVYHRPWIDRFVSFFIPIVFFLAFGTFLTSYLLGFENLQGAFLRALSLVLISCPCSLGVAAPMAESLLLSSLAKMGVVVRNREALIHLGKESVFVFDKTKTLTEGCFTLIGGLEGLHSCFKGVLKAMVGQSIHPLSCALQKMIHQETADLKSLKEYPGKGLEAIDTKGSHYLLGSERFFKERGFCCESKKKEASKTELFFDVDGRVLITLFFEDRLRLGTKQCLESLKPKKRILLSGDCEAAVSSLAKELAFDDYKSRCLPEDKLHYIEQLKREKECVCFVGDGINDALAINCADVGISFLNASEISVQVSDILMTSKAGQSHEKDLMPSR